MVRYVWPGHASIASRFRVCMRRCMPGELVAVAQSDTHIHGRVGCGRGAGRANAGSRSGAVERVTEAQCVVGSG